MTNKEFQKELQEKIRAGIKPSDIKKEREKQAKKTVSPSPIVENDEGYESEENVVPSVPTPPPLPNPEIKNLQEQIKALKRQVKVYQDFKEADLKIKQKLKGEVEQYKKAENYNRPKKPRRKPSKRTRT